MADSMVSRRSSSRCVALLKTDYPRAVDDWIRYFGERPSSRTSGGVPDTPGRAEGIAPARRGLGGAAPVSVGVALR
jgi:hypothetical protein